MNKLLLSIIIISLLILILKFCLSLYEYKNNLYLKCCKYKMKDIYTREWVKAMKYFGFKHFEFYIREYTDFYNKFNKII